MKQVIWLNLLLSLLFLMSAVFNCSQKHFRSTNYIYQVPKQIGDGLEIDNLANSGFDTTPIIQLTKLILADSFPNIHSLLIAKDNKLVYENYFEGKDENWGSNLGYAKHDTNILHDTRSISKSVVAACIDIAIQQQKIKSIDDPIFKYLPEYTKYKTAQNEAITIKHLLTMSSGIEWEENNVSHGTSANNETQMEKSINPIEYVLSQSMDTLPGKIWKYNSGGVQVLAEIIRNISGENIDIFAAKYLFAPLGIKDYTWTYSSNIAIWFHLNKLLSRRRKFPAAASGLRLTSRDLLKFGLLYLNKGKWNNNQILSENWVNETLETKIIRNSASSATNGYSYLFWTQMDTVDNKKFPLISAKGNGGQRIFINQTSNLVVVITAGNYNKNDIKNDGQLALDKYILSALR